MIKFTATSIVLYFVNLFILKLYVRCSKGASFRLKYDLYKGKEKNLVCQFRLVDDIKYYFSSGLHNQTDIYVFVGGSMMIKVLHQLSVFNIAR